MLGRSDCERSSVSEEEEEGYDLHFSSRFFEKCEVIRVPDRPWLNSCSDTGPMLDAPISDVSKLCSMIGGKTLPRATKVYYPFVSV